ncbi:L-idonate 5-dehydrogenase [Microbacterium sp. H1-D42]|uniref:L-idonate 5-dehydrogenase n=1 Tax=Microbacterium sp. H1-D42 TaxID=2925844 RepID=UPI001F530619|nr:L-idonate 5-dehydrogenase [Microbacterium sp. H1-D42]UNK70342.1 L-idonate 5-dehydrogenase [Microbacterium sp. H1-D42]
MRAVVVHAANDLRVTEVASPDAGTDGILIQMAYGGICGSDLAYWKHGASGTAILRDPLILGHEVSGTVAGIGTDVAADAEAAGIRIGAPVTVHPATRVGEPAAWPGATERPNLWPVVRYFGSAAVSPHEDGGFSNLRRVRLDQVRLLPAGVTLRDGAIVEPLSVALHAISRAGDVRGRSVLVNGCGPIGSLVIAALRHAGAGRVIGADVSAHALAVATAGGADEVVNVGAGEPLPQNVDVSIEASGVGAALGGVIGATRPGGVIVQAGNLRAGTIEASIAGIVTKEIDYRGSYRFVDEMDTAIRMLADGLDVSPVISHEFAMADAEEAFRTATTPQASKVLLRLDA